MPNPPASVSVAGFKAYFARDFTFGDGPDTVMDADVSRAIAEAASNFAPDLWDSEETNPYYYILSAHVMALNIQAAGGLTPKMNAGQGVFSKGSAIVAAKSVGAVSVQYDTQDESYRDPILAWFNRTEYGRKYLQAALPRMVGHVDVAAGATEPDITIPQIPVEPPLT